MTVTHIRAEEGGLQQSEEIIRAEEIRYGRRLCTRSTCKTVCEDFSRVANAGAAKDENRPVQRRARLLLNIHVATKLGRLRQTSALSAVTQQTLSCTQVLRKRGQ